MNIITRIPSKTRLQLGAILTILGLLSVFLLDKYNLGFLGGLLSGVLVGAGVGLMVTYKSK